MADESLIRTVPPDRTPPIYTFLDTPNPPFVIKEPVEVEDESVVSNTVTVPSVETLPVVAEILIPFPPCDCIDKLPISFLSVELLTPPSAVRVDEFKNKFVPEEPPSFNNFKILYELVEFEIFRTTTETGFDASVR